MAGSPGDRVARFLASGQLKERCSELIQVQCAGCGDATHSTEEWANEGNCCPICSESNARQRCGRCGGVFHAGELGEVREHPCKSVEQYYTSGATAFPANRKPKPPKPRRVDPLPPKPERRDSPPKPPAPLPPADEGEISGWIELIWLVCPFLGGLAALSIIYKLYNQFWWEGFGNSIGAIVYWVALIAGQGFGLVVFDHCRSWPEGQRRYWWLVALMHFIMPWALYVGPLANGEVFHGLFWYLVAPLALLGFAAWAADECSDGSFRVIAPLIIVWFVVAWSPWHGKGTPTEAESAPERPSNKEAVEKLKQKKTDAPQQKEPAKTEWQRGDAIVQFDECEAVQKSMTDENGVKAAIACFEDLTIRFPPAEQPASRFQNGEIAVASARALATLYGKDGPTQDVDVAKRWASIASEWDQVVERLVRERAEIERAREENVERDKVSPDPTIVK